MKLQTNENETNEHVALNFETLKYDPSESFGDILLDNSCDPNLHFFNTNIQNLDTPYILHFTISSFNYNFSIIFFFFLSHGKMKQITKIQTMNFQVIIV